MSAYRICLLPGDGIGPEVVSAARRVLESLPLEFEWSEAGIGLAEWQLSGNPLPDETLQAIKSADATLFGSVTTPPDIANYRSPVLRMRQELDLYANLRPCRSIPHAISRPGINLLVVRENTEDLYIGRERIEDNGDTAIGEMQITRSASTRIAHAAFEQARLRGLKKVTIVHKANVLRQTSGLFRRVTLEVAQQYPDIPVEEMLVDTCAMELIRAPEQFGVIVTTNLFGDILSDEASMLVGGLGLACSGNIGAETAVFEPVHGSAPKMADLDQANPLATILSTAMLLDYLGEGGQARRIEAAVRTAIEQNLVTADLGGTLGTQAAADAIINLLGEN
ncbi:MAG TPA: NAD-dependent isocitrate dehydrogenase [Anaerolineaceae bacterium]|nr:NAD-dependent isocitrate dehydrogenase [Anaerolineaceae bacterium]